MEPILINTKGHCFLCLDEGDGFGIQSLQSLCRYSKIDVGNILTSFTFGITSSSNVKVSLCMKCNKVVSQISCKYQLLESLQMELDNLVGIVNKSIEGADAQEKSIQKERFLANMNADLGCRLQLKLVEELRVTLFNKCNKISSTLQPTVHAMEFEPIVKAEHVTVLIDEDQGHTNTLTTTGVDRSDSSATSQSENDDDETFQHDGEPTTLRKTRGQPPIHKTVQSGETLTKKKIGRPRELNSLNAKLRENSYFNPESGKIKCGKCPKEFKDISTGFRFHFESKHLGIRHNCNFCKKSFSQKAHLNKHKTICRQKTRLTRVQPKLTESETSTLPLDDQPMDDLDIENMSQSQDEDETIQLEGETTLKKRRGRPPSNKTLQSRQILRKKQMRRQQNSSRFSAELSENSYFNPESGMIECAKCPKKFKDIGNAFRWHFESQHLGIRYNCRYCKKSFSLKGPLGRHRKVCHQKARMRKAQPDTTESETSTSSPLDVSQIDDLDSEDIPEKVGESENSESNDFFKSIIFNKCKDCSGIFYNLDSLREHRKTVHSSNGSKTPIFAQVHSYNSS